LARALGEVVTRLTVVFVKSSSSFSSQVAPQLAVAESEAKSSLKRSE